MKTLTSKIHVPVEGAVEKYYLFCCRSHVHDARVNSGSAKPNEASTHEQEVLTSGVVCRSRLVVNTLDLGGFFWWNCKQGESTKKKRHHNASKRKYSTLLPKSKCKTQRPKVPGTDISLERKTESYPQRTVTGVNTMPYTPPLVTSPPKKKKRLGRMTV
jgi:hypothetical protein